MPIPLHASEINFAKTPTVDELEIHYTKKKATACAQMIGTNIIIISSEFVDTSYNAVFTKAVVMEILVAKEWRDASRFPENMEAATKRYEHYLERENRKHTRLPSEGSKQHNCI